MQTKLKRELNQQRSAWLKCGVGLFMLALLIYALLAAKVTATFMVFFILGTGWALDGLADILQRHWDRGARLVRILRLVCILATLPLLIVSLSKA